MIAFEYAYVIVLAEFPVLTCKYLGSFMVLRDKACDALE